jgi:hypothetical protein
VEKHCWDNVHRLGPQGRLAAAGPVAGKSNNNTTNYNTRLPSLLPYSLSSPFTNPLLVLFCAAPRIPLPSQTQPETSSERKLIAIVKIAPVPPTPPNGRPLPILQLSLVRAAADEGRLPRAQGRRGSEADTGSHPEGPSGPADHEGANTSFPLPFPRIASWAVSEKRDGR